MKQFTIALLFFLGLQTTYAKENVQNITLQVTAKGFEPNKISVKPGTHVVLKITRKTDDTCATQVKIKEKNINAKLPLNKEVSVDVGTLAKGDIKFACGMDMISGHIIVE